MDYFESSIGSRLAINNTIQKYTKKNDYVIMITYYQPSLYFKTRVSKHKQNSAASTEYTCSLSGIILGGFFAVGYFCWLLVSAGQSNFCIYQFSRKLQTTLSFGVFEFETKTWKHLFSMKFGRLTNLVVLKLNSKHIF